MYSSHLLHTMKFLYLRNQPTTFSYHVECTCQAVLTSNIFLLFYKMVTDACNNFKIRCEIIHFHSQPKVVHNFMLYFQMAFHDVFVDLTLCASKCLFPKWQKRKSLKFEKTDEKVKGICK
jgi:hypothetical protein